MSARTGGRWTLWIASACVLAFGTLASAQMESKGGTAGASSAQTGASSAGVSQGGTLSGQGSVLLAPPYVGFCGTPDGPGPCTWKPAYVHDYLVAAAVRSLLLRRPTEAGLHLALARMFVASKPGIAKS